MENIEADVNGVLQKLVAAAAAPSLDWSHYEWHHDVKSNPSTSTSNDSRKSSSDDDTTSSSCSSSSVSDDQIRCGAAAKKMGKWKGVHTKQNVNAQIDIVESKPAQWPTTPNWTVDLADPLLVGQKSTEFEESECYFKGVKWAPDGSCWLTSSNDNTLRIFNLPQFYCQSEMALSTLKNEFDAVVKINEGASIYDFCWYPFMDSSQPQTCFFLSSSKDHPVHLWDAFTGQLCASYIARNHVDVLIAPFSLHCCKMEGRHIYAGYNRQIRLFDLERPGNNALLVKNTIERSMFGQGQTGMISCFAQEPTAGTVMAAGCYDKSIGLYGGSEMTQFGVMTAHRAGVTHLAFGSSGYHLYSGARKDGEILCWDIRRPGLVVASYPRVVTTNQRIYFEIIGNDRHLISGSSDGRVLFFDLKKPISSSSVQEMGSVPVVEPSFSFQPHSDCTNGLSFHPSLPLLLTSSGQRWFNMKRLIDCSPPGSPSGSLTTLEDDYDRREFEIPRTSSYTTNIQPENSNKLWQFEALSD